VLGESLGQQVVIDNRPGASSVIGLDLVAKSKPDGYTLGASNIAYGANPFIIGKMPFDSEKDLLPVSLTALVPMVLSVHPSMPPRSVKQLIALAKARPGQINYASAGNASASHLVTELFIDTTGAKMVHIPYKGGGPALADFFGGQVDIFVAIVSTVTPHVQSGKARALAVTGYKRAAALPDVPTVAENGFPGYESTNWYCLVGPSNLPRPIVDRWHRETVAVLEQPAIRQALLERGIDPAPSTPAELARYLRSESEKWARMAKATGLQAN
jgi:tripartite-type tricarboxylate transporter receptor subunit TctC